LLENLIDVKVYFIVNSINQENGGQKVPESASAVTDETIVELVQTVHQGLSLIGRNYLSPTEADMLRNSQQAEAALLMHYRGLVGYIVQKIYHIRPEADVYDDTIQNGYIGVVRGIRESDISRLSDDHPLNSLTSFVFYRIRTETQRGFVPFDIINRPSYIHSADYNERTFGESKVKPSLKTASQMARRVISLDSGQSFGTSREYTDTEGLPRLKRDPVDILASGNDGEDGWPLPANYGLAVVMNHGLNWLKRSEQQVLAEHFTGEETLDEIAANFGVTRERVRQLETAAFIKLRGNTVFRRMVEDYLSGNRDPRDDYWAAEPPSVAEPAADKFLERALMERLNNVVSEYLPYRFTPRVAKKVVGLLFQQAKRLQRQGSNVDDIVEQLYPQVTDLSDLPGIQNEYEDEKPSFLKHQKELETRGKQMPAQLRQIEQLENEIRLGRQLTRDLSYGTERFEKHVLELKGKQIELERLRQAVADTDAELFEGRLDEWLRRTTKFYQLPYRLSLTVLSVGRDTLRDLAGKTKN